MQNSLNETDKKPEESGTVEKWSDPSGKCYVASFEDAEEEQAWIDYIHKNK